MIRFPRGVEREVARRLLQRLRVLETVLAERIEPDSTPAEIVAAIEATRRALGESIGRLPAALPRHARAIASQTQDAVLAEVKRQTGVDARDDIRLAVLSRELAVARVRWTKQVAELVRKAEQETLARLRARLTAATGAKAILEEETSRLKGRLQLIARSEVGTLQAAVSEGTQRAIGVDSYTWVTQGDERVRSSHERLAGTVRRWDDPHPTEGHPGQAIGCRCVARPLVAPVAAPQPRTRPRRATPRPVPAPAPVPQQAPRAPTPAPTPTPTPPSVPAPLDLTAAGVRAVAPAAVTRALGRPASVSEILGWAGVAQEDLIGARVDVDIVDDQVELQVDCDRFSLVRQYGRRPDGTLYAHHDLFEIHKAHQGAGLGSDMFFRQVEALRKGGFVEIETLAAGDKSSTAFNGYYTWPRLGYDGDLSGKVAQRLPPQFAGVTRISELMSSKEGRAWWKENGEWADVTFDLRPGSYSSRVLEAYVKEKAAKGKARGDRREDAREPGERRQEEIDLTDEESEAADRVLDQVASRT